MSQFRNYTVARAIQQITTWQAFVNGTAVKIYATLSNLYSEKAKWVIRATPSLRST